MAKEIYLNGLTADQLSEMIRESLRDELQQLRPLRSSAASSVVRERLRPQHLHHILQLTGMANNLNQISRKANAAGYVNARTEYRNLASEIDDLISRIKDDR